MGTKAAQQRINVLNVGCQKLILVNTMRNRTKLKNGLLILMSPLLSRTRDKIREQQLNFMNSSSSQLISSTGEMPGLTAAAKGKSEYNRFSKNLSKAVARYKIINQSPSSGKFFQEPLPGIGVNLLVASRWLEESSLQLRYPLPFRSKALQAWMEAQHASSTADEGIRPNKISQEITKAAKMGFAERPFGVNLIGHAFNVFGIGEDSRAIADALRASSIPFCVIDYPASNGSATSDRRLEDLTLPPGEEGPYAFNLVCMAAPIHARWYCEQGLKQQRGRYTIVSWPWEMERWPAHWEPILQLADEAWPYSSIIKTALLPYSQVGDGERTLRATRMPPPAEIENPDRYINPKARRDARKRFGLPNDKVLFVFGFDLNSTMSRKNPIAVIEAFRRAFPPEDLLGEMVGLVIKTLSPTGPHQAWDELKVFASLDPRLHVIEASLERTELLALCGCCDGFVSLHRSEGLGRGHAEALQLGLDVIVTDYSSTTDFCTGRLAHPVRYELIPVLEGEYFDYEGQVWADADVDHAAEQLRKVALHRLEQPEPDQGLAASYRQRFASANVGRHYRERLEELWAKRQILAASLKANRLAGS
jgi:hypothetical protein